MSGYIRTDISCWWNKDVWYLIPTITFNKWAKGIELSFNFLCFVVYGVISYIKEEDYEP